MDKVKDKIEKRIEETDWKFSELLQLKEVSENVAQELYDGLTYGEKLSLIWEEKITADCEFFGSVFEKLVKAQLSEKVMEAFQLKFEDAKVKFQPNELEEIVEAELPPPPLVKEKAESITEDIVEKNQTLQDLSELKGDTSVSTKYGNVKVTRG